MRQYLEENIRNVALAGHGSSGKTSLAEAMLYISGSSDRWGKIEDGTTVCDYDPEEIRRKASISSAVAPLPWGSTKINLLDTPGLFDFASGVYEGISAAESVLITVSGKSGLTVGVEKAYKAAVDMGRARMFFISKLDRDSADFYKVLEELKAKFGPAVCPIVVPYVWNRQVQCYINLIDMKAYTYDEHANAKECPMPDTGHRLDGLIAAISEAVAETDEALFEKYFSGEAFTREEILSGIRAGVKNATIAPVLCGSALTLEGVDMLLDMIVNLLPSAKEAAGVLAADTQDEPVEIPCDQAGPLAAYVFKTIADPFVGKMSFIKVISGRLSAEMSPINATTGEAERMGKLVYVRGKKQEDTTAISAGDIGVATKLTAVKTGDTLCDPKRVVKITPPDFPKACLSMAIQPKSKGDEGKIAQAITRLMEEDPSITYENNTETHQQVISGLGEQHLDVMVSKLKNKFGVEVTLQTPIVPYRETIRKKVKAEGKHKKQTGGHGQFGHVWIEFEPCDSEEMVFAENVFGGAVPKGFFPAVEKGLRDCVKHGTLAGYPVVGLKATLYDGSYHPVDSSEMAFKLAAALAYKAALPEASPVLLEPIISMKIQVPDNNTGDIISEMNKHRGRILGMNPIGDGMQEVQGEAPMSEMHDFATTLRSITQGRGSFTSQFERYEQVPSNLEAQIIEDAKQLHSEE